MIDRHFGKCCTKTCTFRSFQKHFKTFRLSWISYLFFIGIVKRSQHLRWHSSSNRKRLTLKNNLSCANIVAFPIWVGFSVCFQVALERLHMEPYIWLYKFVWSAKNEMGNGSNRAHTNRSTTNEMDTKGVNEQEWVLFDLLTAMSLSSYSSEQRLSHSV